MRSRTTIFALLAVFPLVACGGGDGVGLSGDPLTEEEAAALAEYVVGSGFEQGFSAYEGAGAATPARVPFSYTEEYSATTECPIGGAVAVDATFTAEGDTENENDVTLDFSLTQTHDDCVVIPEDTDTELTLNGAPNISFDFVVELTNGEDVSADGGLGGAVSWSSADGRSGSCPIDMDYTLDVNLMTEQGSASLTGSVCGMNVTETLTLGEQVGTSGA